MNEFELIGALANLADVTNCRRRASGTTVEAVKEVLRKGHRVTNGVGKGLKDSIN